MWYASVAAHVWQHTADLEYLVWFGLSSQAFILEDGNHRRCL